MWRLSAVALLLLSALLLGCDSSKTEDDGSYRYTAFDEAGDVVVKGCLRLDYEEIDDDSHPMSITGTWELSQVKETENLGPQIGEGTLQGSISADGHISINMNPEWDDSNVLLGGHFEDGHFGDISGTWVYSTFGGGINGGTFEATRR